MKVAIATVQVPFINGGAEILVNMLKEEIKKYGHQVDIVTIPFKWYPPEKIVDCMMMGRMIDLTEVNGEKIDRVIALKFPAYYIKHPNKVLWLMHQHRQAYDLWGTEYGDIEKYANGEEVRNLIQKSDSKYIKEARKVYTIAQNTTNRLFNNNGIKSEVLYHPPLNDEKLHCKDYGDYIFYASRIDPMKRQRVLVEAMRYVKTDVKALIAGSGSKSELQYIESMIDKYNLNDKVTMAGFISEEDKIEHYANCLAVYFGAYDEDYGYITLEGFFSQKPVIVHKDAGGPLEFIEHQKNGFVIDCDPKQLASFIDKLYLDKQYAEELGKNGLKSMKEKHISWDYVIQKLIN